MKKIMLYLLTLGFLLSMSHNSLADGTPPDKPRPPSGPPGNPPPPPPPK